MRTFFAALSLCLVGLSQAHAETGTASVYGGERRHNECGRPVASGGVLDCRALTAAMIRLDRRRVPFGTMVKVCRIKTPWCVVVTITDRGPYVRGRIIDLSPAGASALHFSGLARVTVEPLGWSRRSAAKAGWTPQHGAFGGF